MIAKEVVKYFYRHPISKTQQIEPLSDGSAELVLSVTHKMEIIPLIKNWMPHVRVLEPEWIDEMVKEDVNRYLSIDKKVQRKKTMLDEFEKDILESVEGGHWKSKGSVDARLKELLRNQKKKSYLYKGERK